MTDIMHDWKDQRFAFVEESLFPEVPGHIIVLSDIAFWNQHYDELREWCATNGSVVRGMTVDVPNKEVLTLFCLRWN